MILHPNLLATVHVFGCVALGLYLFKSKVLAKIK
jgi:hypothetical protein